MRALFRARTAIAWVSGRGAWATPLALAPPIRPRWRAACLPISLARDLAKYEGDVNRAVTVDTSQAEFDALVSFHYNTGAIFRATLTKRLNAGDRAGAAASFMSWSKPPEIIPRRKAEQALFAKGTYPQARATVWGVDANGRVIWKPVRTLGLPEIILMMQPA